MIRVTFDPFYIDDLQDYYFRNECIREQQYLSQEKLLHLAAFCVSKAAKAVDNDAEQAQSGSRGEAALDAVRQLLQHCDHANPSDAGLKPVIVVHGFSNSEMAARERNSTASTTLTFVERSNLRLRRLLGVAVSPVRRLTRRSGANRKTPLC